MTDIMPVSDTYPVEMIETVYEQVFGERSSGGVTVRAPGRVNLIGSHTDYSGGYVLPGAIDSALFLTGRLVSGSTAAVHSALFGQTVGFDTARPEKDADYPWTDYIKGVVHEFQQRGITVPGFRLAVAGDLPSGAGLSSSAALASGTAFLLNELTGAGFGRKELAYIAKDAETSFAGMQCGIMDQTASLLGRENSLLLIRCAGLHIDYLPWDSSAARILVVHSGVQRTLVGSGFNDRYRTVMGAMSKIREADPAVSASADLTESDLKRHAGHLSPDELTLLGHVVCENARVLAAADALKRGNLSGFGEQLFASYEGSKNRFKVTVPELDHIVDVASECAGVYGAKLMGGGFGGSIAAVCKPEAVEEVGAYVRERFKKKFGYTPPAAACSISHGAETIG